MTTVLEREIEAIARRVAREEAARPLYVHQRTVEAVVGLPRRDYIAAAHAGRFPFVKERRMLVARTSDVVGYFETRLASAAPPDGESGGTPEGRALARVGARRVKR